MDKFTIVYATLGLALVFLFLVVFARVNNYWNYSINPRMIEKTAAAVLLAWLGSCVITLGMFIMS
jgi:hypothetical protein